MPAVSAPKQTPDCWCPQTQRRSPCTRRLLTQTSKGQASRPDCVFADGRKAWTGYTMAGKRVEVAGRRLSKALFEVQNGSSIYGHRS